MWIVIKVSLRGAKLGINSCVKLHNCYVDPVQAPIEPVIDQRKLSYFSSSFRSQIDNDYDPKRANSPSLPFTKEENKYVLYLSTSVR